MKFWDLCVWFSEHEIELMAIRILAKWCRRHGVLRKWRRSVNTDATCLKEWVKPSEAVVRKDQFCDHNPCIDCSFMLKFLTYDVVILMRFQTIFWHCHETVESQTIYLNFRSFNLKMSRNISRICGFDIHILVPESRLEAGFTAEISRIPDFLSLDSSMPV
jgi:hypothetical protein